MSIFPPFIVHKFPASDRPLYGIEFFVGFHSFEWTILFFYEFFTQQYLACQYDHGRNKHFISVPLTYTRIQIFVICVFTLVILCTLYKRRIQQDGFLILVLSMFFLVSCICFSSILLVISILLSSIIMVIYFFLIFYSNL